MVSFNLVEDTAGRVRRAIQERRVTKVSVARAADISEASLRDRLNGDIPFSVRELDAISPLLDISNPFQEED